MTNWTRTLPTRSGIFDHRNLENAKGRAPILERVMFVGYVNWIEDPDRGQGSTPMPLGSGKLRACRLERPMTTDSLTVQEWGGEWRPLDGVALPAAPIQLSAIEPALFDALVSWHEISGIPADPAELERLASYLTVAVIESDPAPAGVAVDSECPNCEPTRFCTRKECNTSDVEGPEHG